MHNPFSVKLELVRGCTQRCPFCPIATIEWRDKPWKFMTADLFYALIDDLSSWLSKFRMEIGMRGEAAFHPQLIPFLEYARRKIPRLQLTLLTNGDIVEHRKPKPEGFRDWVKTLWEAGLNVMLLDCYTEERYALMRGLFPEAKDFFLDNIHPYHYKSPKIQELILVRATPGQDNIIRRYHNMGGNIDITQAAQAGFPIHTITEPLHKMCVRPFRELMIYWDGVVPICCQDWKEESILGHFPSTPTQIIWQKHFQTVRATLVEKQRTLLSPCYRCSDRSGFRVGLEVSAFLKERSQ